MGISGSTYLAAALIDNSTRAARGRAESLQLPSNPAQQTASARHSFFNDILCDENGYSLHRVQLVIWTLVTSAVFVGSLINTYSVPEVDGTMLGLMGLSNGTYLGFKFPEDAQPRVTT